MPLTYSINEEQQQLSIDVVDLNNIILRMRPLVKKAKVFVLRELALYIKRQKSKQLKSPEDQSTRLGRKIVNRLAEVRLLKKMNVNKLCKLVLANVNSHDMLGKCGETLTKQERIVIRVSVCPEIAKFVTDFRDKHNDWPTLVHYLLYKNTSGKWKTTEQKRKATKRKKKKGDLPLPIGELDVSNDEKVESTLQKFKSFKEAHDRELIEAQKRILEEEEAGIEENENDSNKGQTQGDQDINSSEINPNNPEMKVFISELLEKVNKGEEIDDSLLIGADLKDIPEPMEVNTEVREEIEKPKMSKVKQMSEAVNSLSRKPAQSKEKVESEVFKSSLPTEDGEKKKVAKLNRKQRRLAKAKAPAASAELVQMPKIEDDGMLHEIITEDIEDVEEASEDDDILGCDDVEMKQELKNRSAKPGDGAIYRRYVKQRNLHNLRNKFEPNNFRRAGFRRGNISAKPKFAKNVAPKEELPLHPSWEAKKKQKARLSIPIKIVVD
nr:vasodilator stimulated phosphoprotein:sprouty [Hymenolepis microstoma]